VPELIPRDIVVMDNLSSRNVRRCGAPSRRLAGSCCSSRSTRRTSTGSILRPAQDERAFSKLEALLRKAVEQTFDEAGHRPVHRHHPLDEGANFFANTSDDSADYLLKTIRRLSLECGRRLRYK
jgi:hypothetical protein